MHGTAQMVLLFVEILGSACQCEIGYRRRWDRSHRLGSRTGRESCPFIRLLSVRSIAIDTSLGEISVTLIVTMSMEYLEIANGVGAPIFPEDQVVDFPDIPIVKG
jgi:hypothetical protein